MYTLVDLLWVGIIGTVSGAAACAVAAWGQIASARESLQIARRWVAENDRWEQTLRDLALPPAPATLPEPTVRRRTRAAFRLGATWATLRQRWARRHADPSRPAIAAAAAPRPTGWVGDVYYGKHWRTNIDHTTEIPRVA